MKCGTPIPSMLDSTERRRRVIAGRLLEALERDPWHPKRDVQTLARVLADMFLEYEAKLDELTRQLAIVNQRLGTNPMQPREGIMSKGCKYIAIALINGRAIETCPYKDFEELPTQEQVVEFYKEHPEAREVIVRAVSSYGAPPPENITVTVEKCTNEDT